MEEAGGKGSNHRMGLKKVRSLLQPHLPSHGLHCISVRNCSPLFSSVQLIAAVGFHSADPRPP